MSTLPCFPVICFSQNYMTSFADEDAFTQCGKLALKQGYFANMFVVDSQGRGYEIKGANQIGYVGPCWGYRFLKSRQIRVEPHFTSHPICVSLDELKQKVCQTYDRDPGFWESLGELDDLKAEIRACETHKEVIERCS